MAAVALVVLAAAAGCGDDDEPSFATQLDPVTPREATGLLRDAGLTVRSSSVRELPGIPDDVIPAWSLRLGSDAGGRAAVLGFRRPTDARDALDDVRDATAAPSAAITAANLLVRFPRDPRSDPGLSAAVRTLQRLAAACRTPGTDDLRLRRLCAPGDAGGQDAADGSPGGTARSVSPG